MSVMKSIDKTAAALERSKTKIVRLYDFVSGLSIKNKANLDIQVKSDRCFAPLCRHSFGYSKEFRVMPVIWTVLAMTAICAAIKISESKD